MSWSVDDWTAGLSGRALQKVRELEVQLEQLKREKQQREMKVDNAEAALNKQKLKFEEVRGELLAAQRDLQASQEESQTGLRARERLSQELQVKQAQVCGLEGQLDAARKLANTLTQEVKRLEAELEKLQNVASSGDPTPFSTPCWNTPSSRDHDRLRWEEKEQYRGEEETSRALHVRRLQFSDRSPSTPLRRPNSSISAVFPWEREDAGSGPKGRPSPSSDFRADVVQAPSQGDYGIEEDLRRENEAQRSEIRQLKTWVQSLEQEARCAAEQKRSLEAQLVETRRDVASREHNASRLQEELARTNTCLEKESNRVQAGEQRAKQLQEELSCQRQNAESSRRNAEQRRREMEKEHQRELLELQKERQTLEKQHQQEVIRLKQELQQAQTLHNNLQAQCDKVLLQKQALEKDVDNVKGKLQWTERELQESRKAEAQSQSKLAESLRETDGLRVQLDQTERRIKSLEEEVKRLTQELSEALRLLEQLKEAHAAPAVPAVPVRFCPTGDAVAPLEWRERPQRVPAVVRKRSKKPEEEELEEIVSTTKYPADREPGEGIDSSVIRAAMGRSKVSGEGEGSYAAVPGDDMETGAADETSRTSCEEAAEASSKRSEPPRQDLQKENVTLRDELREAKRELELRLEDLEKQRQAEAQARTKLKQLSRKHSGQAEQLRHKSQELQEEVARLGKQLEEKRVENERLRNMLDGMGKEKEREVVEGMERDKELEDRRAEQEMWEAERKRQLGESEALRRKLSELEGAMEELQRRREESETDEKASPAPDLLNENFSNGNENNNNNAATSVTATSAVEGPEGTLALVLEVERLRAERAREAGRASQAQERLEALQRQVNSQTQQLTQAFESQSGHIRDLLLELQERDEALRGKSADASLLEDALRDLRLENQGLQARLEASAPLPELHPQRLTSAGLQEEERSHAQTQLQPPGTECGDASERPTGDLPSVQLTTSFPEQQQGLSYANSSIPESPKPHTAQDVPLSTTPTQPQTLAVEDRSAPQWPEEVLHPTGQGVELQRPNQLLEDQSGLLEILEGEEGKQGNVVTLLLQGTNQKSLEIIHLKKQEAELRSQLFTLSEENRRLEEELEMWRLTENTISPVSLGEATVHQRDGSIVLLREDHLLVSFRSDRKREGKAEEVIYNQTESEDAKYLQDGVMENCKTKANELTAESTHSSRLNPNGFSTGAGEDDAKGDQGKEQNTTAVKLATGVCAPTHCQTKVSDQQARENSQSYSTVEEDGRSYIEVKSSSSQTEDSRCRLTDSCTQTDGDENIDSPDSPQLSLIDGPSCALTLTGPFPIPADPAQLAERIRRHRNRMSAAFDDTEYEPYGLPEVVMKGFADIPMGPACPYVLRRGLLGTTAMPLPLNEDKAETPGDDMDLEP